MKNKFISWVLSFLLLVSLPVYGSQEVPIRIEVDEIVKTEENKGIIVPSKTGTKKASPEEEKIIKNLERRPLQELVKAYIIGDYFTGEIYDEYNVDQVLPLASTSKLVSAFVVLDKIADGTIDYNDQIVIDKESSLVKGSSYNLKEGERVTVKELLQATLIISGNDAVTALGKYIAGSTEGFVEMMNEKCKSLGLKHAHMINPHGLTDHEANDYNKMTTRELFQLSSTLIKEYPEILEITKERKLEDSHRKFLKYNTNPMLDIIPEIDGLKTGYTSAAGLCLIATGLKKGVPGVSEDQRLVGITMGAKGKWPRFVAMNRLWDGFGNKSLRKIADPEEKIGELTMNFGYEDTVSIYPEEYHQIPLRKVEVVTRKINLDPISPPITKGSVVGRIFYYVDGKETWSTNAIVKEDLSRNETFLRVKKLMDENL
ncbi:MAG: D-alanyl-D-alanine carboxypeptidase family protein [Tissierellia bacterium]|nr:D-alanyl-D-alanine carboxypeptidase family protein [Tissierellia bacterium]